MARSRGSYTRGGERVGRSKMVVGGKVSMPDGTIGTVQRVFGDSKSRRAVVITDGGSYNVPVSELKPTAGRPRQETVRPSSGTLDPEVARGEKPDSKGKYRAPIPDRVFQKLQAMGRIGGGSNDEIIDPMTQLDLVDIKTKRPGGDSYRFGGLVRRKNSFKGVF